MPLIEGFRVRNYRALRDVTLGRLPADLDGDPLTPITAVIGKNGVGKTSLFDAFGFVADCLASGVETACAAVQRGGFDRLRSAGSPGPIRFDIAYRERPGEGLFTYAFAIDLDRDGRPVVLSEALLQRPCEPDSGGTCPVLQLEGGSGVVWGGEPGFYDPDGRGPGGSGQAVALTDVRQLGLATFGTLKDHPPIARLRDFLRGWYFSYFRPDNARALPSAGPQQHLNMSGDNLGNVVQFMEREHGERFAAILSRIAARIPGLERIDTHVTEDNRILLRFGSGAFKDPFFAQQMSDGTLKLFAYLLLLEDPEPPPFICVEEPENGLYHKLLDVLAQEFRDRAGGKPGDPQIFVTTHQPYFVDALSPEEVWILEKGADGFSQVTRASDLADVKNLFAEGLPLGSLWYSDYLDAR